MTKVAIVSDIHLKLRKHKDFERSRFRQLIQILANSDADIIIINGDLLDYAIPTLEEIKELHDAFDVLSDKTIYLLAGNHEAVNRESSTYDYLSFAGVLKPEDGSQIIYVEDIGIKLCDWNQIHNLKFGGPSEILITHYRSALEGLYGEEVQTADFINKHELILLGDIHFRYSPLPHVFYTGSPYSIAATRKVSEEFGYIELTLDAGDYSWKYINLGLPQKVRIDLTFSHINDFKPNPKHLYNLHVTGTIQELKTLENYGNVFFTKVVELKEPIAVQNIAPEKTFIDNLSEKVETQIDGNHKHKTKSILVQIQGDT